MLDSPSPRKYLLDSVIYSEYGTWLEYLFLNLSIFIQSCIHSFGQASTNLAIIGSYRPSIALMCKQSRPFHPAGPM